MAVCSTISFSSWFIFGREVTYTLTNEETSMSELSHTITFSNSYGDVITHELPLGVYSGTITFPYEWLEYVPNGGSVWVDYTVVTKCASWSKSYSYSSSRNVIINSTHKESYNVCPITTSAS